MSRGTAIGRARLAVAALVVLHALPFLTRPALIGGDEPHYALMAHSLGVDGDVDLEPDYLAVEAGSMAAGRKFAGQRLDRHYVDRDGELFFAHPLGLSAAAAPFVAALDAIAPGAAPDLVLALLGLALTLLALGAGYRLLLMLDLSPGEAVFVAFAIYFATPLWFYSRLFFTESFSWSLTVLAIYLLSRERWLAASVLLGSTFLIKEPNALLILAVLAGVWSARGARRAAFVAIGPIGALGIWMVKNLWIYGEPVVMFQPYQTGDPIAGAIGLVIDSQHGLLPFAPVLGVALLVFWRRPAQAGEGPGDRLGDRPGAIELVSLAAFLATFAMTALWNVWGGGSCYGPRLLVHVIPALTLSIVAVWRGARTSLAGRTVFVLLVGCGFAIQLLAAMDPFHAFWEIPVGELLMTRPWLTAAALIAGIGTASVLARRTSLHP